MIYLKSHRANRNGLNSEQASTFDRAPRAMRRLPLRHFIYLTIFTLSTACAQLPVSPVPVISPTQSRAVVFDIDGTLTPSIPAFTKVRPDAAKAINLYAEKGYKIIYLSVRINVLQAGIPAWLEENGFPAGTLHVSQSDDPAAYKAQMLQQYVAKGWTLVGGYGDSSTDFQAYAAASIPKQRVFALQRKGETACQPGDWQMCLQGWTEHLSFIANANE